MAARESGRIKDAYQKRILDDAARKRRQKKALEALEQDNFHDDPHADLGEFLYHLLLCYLIFTKLIIYKIILKI